MEAHRASPLAPPVPPSGRVGSGTVAADSAGFYTRKATGLVREISPSAAFWMNMTYCSIPLSVLAFTVAPSAFPGVSLFWSVVLISLLALIPTLVYGVLAATMPRSGGDYVWQSRILHPSIGFASNFNFTIATIFFTGLLSTWISGFAGSTALLTLGTVLHSSTLVHLSVHASQRGWELAFALLFIVLFGIASAFGAKVTMKAMVWLYVTCMAGQLLVVVVLALTDHAAFVHSFNHYASYANVIALGHSKVGGFSTHATALAPTLATMPLIYSGIGFAMVSTYVSGEIKSVKKSSLYSTCGAVVGTGVVLAVLALLATHVFSINFLGSINSIAASKKYPLSSQPFFYLFASMATSSSVVIVLIAIAFEAGVIAVIPALYMIATRNIFAWSFDRVMPSKLADVNSRTGAPVNATILTAVIMGAFAACYLFVPLKWTAFIAGLEVMGLFTFALVGLCGIILPWRRPDIWELSPYKWMIGKVPVISLLGAATLAIEIWLIYYLVTNKALGADSPSTLRLEPSLVIIGFLWFAAAAWFARRRGMSLIAGQAELPPE